MRPYSLLLCRIDLRGALDRPRVRHLILPLDALDWRTSLAKATLDHDSKSIPRA